MRTSARILFAVALLVMLASSSAIDIRGSGSGDKAAKKQQKKAAKAEKKASKALARDEAFKTSRTQAAAQIEKAKTFFKGPWDTVKDMRKYQTVCLVSSAPSKLGLKASPTDAAFCKDFALKNKDFVATMQVIAKLAPVGEAVACAQEDEESESPTAGGENGGSSSDGSTDQSVDGSTQTGGGSTFVEVEAKTLLVGDPSQKWPSKDVKICVKEDVDPQAAQALAWAMFFLQTYVGPCLQFQFADCADAAQKITVQNHESRCFYQKDGHILNWAPTCTSGNALHSFLHALGFQHEIQRLDRDNYITVHEDQIEPSKKKLVEKASGSAKDYGVYNFKSIMHHRSNSFTKSGSRTIVEKLRSLQAAGPTPAPAPAVQATAAGGQSTGESGDEVTQSVASPSGDLQSSGAEALGSPWKGEMQRSKMTKTDVLSIYWMYECPLAPVVVALPDDGDKVAKKAAKKEAKAAKKAEKKDAKKGKK